MSRDFSEPTEPKQPPPDALLVDRERLDRIDAVLADDVRLHCTCVPTLRAEIAKLRGLLEQVDGIVVSHDVLAWRRLKDNIRAALTEGGGE